MARLRIHGIQEHIFTVDIRCLKKIEQSCAAKASLYPHTSGTKWLGGKSITLSQTSLLSTPPLSSCKICVTVVSSACILWGIIKPISHFVLRIKRHNVHSVTDFQKVLWESFLKMTFKNKWWEKQRSTSKGLFLYFLYHWNAWVIYKFNLGAKLGTWEKQVWRA